MSADLLTTPKAKRSSSLSSHRKATYNEDRVRVSRKTHIALSKLAEKQGMSMDLTIEYLLLFYDLRCLDLLIEKIKARFDEGFSPLEINQISVLYTLLGLIDRRIGLHR